MKSISILAFTVFVLISSAVSAQFKTPDWVSKAGARKFSFKQKKYLVNQYGALNDGKTLSTKAIQKAIDDCAAKGEVRFLFNRASI
ncbi:hypothetical protein [Pedobacter sp. HDW13]|uniref:hypothetical protein n=1 Tax=Pedobacter sp. HDW13 TaxID=2714940 RepID=UPI001F0EA9FC|nr:hypothetical protein [Pedobacter sp. HDW13]